MRNFEKYKTSQERAEAFEKFCITREICNGCELDCDKAEKPSYCQFAWLDLEAEEEKPLPCPYCGGECIKETKCMKGYRMFCERDSCGYVSSWKKTMEAAIDAHNRVAKAVSESEVK